MAENKRGLKRKSRDFIYEVTENDLSTDDESPAPKSSMTKIVRKSEKLSDSTPDVSNLQTDCEDSSPNISVSNETSTNCTGESKETESNSENKPSSMTKETCIDEVSKTSESVLVDENNVILIEDNNDMSNDMNCSVQIIERNVSIIEVSDQENDVEIIEESQEQRQLDHDTEAETVVDSSIEGSQLGGEFVVVDEVTCTPITSRQDKVDNTIITIKFENEEIKQCYECKFLEFLNSISEFDVESNNLSITIKNKFKTPESEVVVPQKTKKKNKKKKAKKELFVLDTNPSENDSLAPLRYSSKFSIEEEKLGENLSRTKKFTQQCFNCEGEHSLRDCTQPKDYNKINASRQKFMNRSKSTRYHEEEDQKFAHLKPGVISDNLKKALGLRKFELPSYIYGMRALGYPPGWLEEAKITHSSLSMFDIHGDKVKETAKKDQGLDPDKIISYSGFNAKIEKGYKDEYKRYNVLPYSKNLSKEAMLNHYESMLPRNTESDDQSDSDEEKRNPMRKNDAVQRLMENSERLNSPSLSELEEKKKLLLKELNSPSSSRKKDDENSSEIIENRHDAVITVKDTTFGTPILKSSSPYSRLPNPNNFMVGVSPMIDFENLTDSTGKYEQISGVLDKVRTTLKNLEGFKS